MFVEYHSLPPSYWVSKLVKAGLYQSMQSLWRQAPPLQPSTVPYNPLGWRYWSRLLCQSLLGSLDQFTVDVTGAWTGR